MSKFLTILVAFVFAATLASSQNMLEWSADHKLTVDDFEAGAPNTGQLQTVLGSFSVSYEISGLNLFATRNLNQYVHCNFQKDASYIDHADKATIQRLLSYQQLIFNLYELEARNLRKKFFEEKSRLITKGPGVMYEEVNAEHTRLIAKVESETFLGSSVEEIARWTDWTVQELDKLGDFCLDCTPVKKRKNQ